MDKPREPDHRLDMTEFKNHPHHNQMNMNKPKFITNMPHQHALILVGDKTIYGVHMTQYHHEEHKYQMILELELEETAAEAYRDMRLTWPEMSFVLCNSIDDPLMVPELGGGTRQDFKANIFAGLFPLELLTEQEIEDPHFFPWSPSICRPFVYGAFEVKVKRVVLFRPFNHNEILPKYANYLLWGQGEEAHMTHLQTAHMASDKYGMPAFGPDYDHILSLKRAPDWVDAPLLSAGITVSVPSISLRDPEKKRKPTIPMGRPFKKNRPIEMRYRGIGLPYTAVAGETFVFGAMVSASPSTIPPMNVTGTPDQIAEKTMFMTAMPEEFWAEKRARTVTKDAKKDD